MKTYSSLRLALAAAGWWFGLSAAAQLNIPLPNIALANTSLPAVTINLNGNLRNVLPTPLLLSGTAIPPSAQWFCLDPLQAMYYQGSGEPAGNSLHYAGSNPLNFDPWGANAPGFNPVNTQDLADLFHAYLPAANNSLTLGALQLAVWEIANEATGNPYALDSGFLIVSSFNGPGAATMIATANSMLASLDLPANMNKGDVASLDFLIDGSYQRIGTTNTVLVQDLLGFSLLPPVPEPAAFGVAGAGLLAGIVAAGKFRHRTRSRKPKPDHPS